MPEYRRYAKMGFQKYTPLILFLIHYALAFKRGAEPTWSSPKMTSMAEQLEKFEREVSPATTSPPSILQRDLLRRDYSLPSDNCGWDLEYKSLSSTCDVRGASCINYGSLRGCCTGAVSDCASTTFFSACIPFSSIDKVNTAECGSKGILCCDTEYPECGTYLMSSRANRDRTYTMLNCWLKGYGTTRFLQDYPPDILTTESDSLTTTETLPPPATTTTTVKPPPPPPKSTPVGAIVGGVVGGLAVIALLVIGIFFYRRKKTTNGPAVEQVNLPTARPPNEASPASPPVYNTQTSYTAWPPTNLEPISPIYNSPGGHYQIPPSTSPGSEECTSIPVGQEPKEMPATNPVGTGDNRAELS